MTGPHGIRCAFLTTDDLEGYVVDDRYAADALRDRGWTVEEVAWDDGETSWDAFDVVVVRSTWDYHHRLEAFLEVLSEIDESGTPLFNALPLVRWNARKTYLQELGRAGIEVVPTAWRERLEEGELDELFDELRTGEIVVKPVVGAGADDLFRISRSGQGTASRVLKDELQRDGRSSLEDGERSLEALVEKTFADRALLAQPFLSEIVDEGEYSLCYFGGRFAHAVRKEPADRDFRVQEERGAKILPADPDRSLIDWGRRVIDTTVELVEKVSRPPLYARVDLVRTERGPLLMELELIEPALYFRIDPPAGEQFADVLAGRCG